MKLSIIISERNDPFGTLITIRSVMEDLKSCNFDAEIIVIDNSDIVEKSKIFVDIATGFIKRNEIKLLNLSTPCLFSARDLGVLVATGEYILVLDSHCLLYYETIKKMIEKADSLPNLGVLFGSMCYSRTHELDAFVDRRVDTFYPIRLSAYSEAPDCFKVPLRGMPYMIKRELFNKMRGYEPLSTHKLVWGGGDFLISFKPLILGYDNYVLTSVGAIHLGPFLDGGFFTTSFNHGDGKSPHKYVGMLTAAYVIGGEELLVRRYNALSSRYGQGQGFERLKYKALEYGANFHRWILKHQKRTYDDIYKQFNHIQGDVNYRKYTSRYPMPESTQLTKKDVYVTQMFSSQKPITIDYLKKRKKINWRDLDCSQIKQTNEVSL